MAVRNSGRVSAAATKVKGMSDFHVLTPTSMARNKVWRNHTARGVDAELTDILNAASTAVVVSHRGYVLGARGRLYRFDPSAVSPEALDGTRIYLGQVETGHIVGIELSDAARQHVDRTLAQRQAVDAEVFLDSPATGIRVQEPTWFDLRMVAMDLDDVDVALATALVAVGNWHRTHTHSPRNGQPTVPINGGWVRQEPETGSEHFPRTDPAVIMAVIHTDEAGEERILLGNNALWPEGRYSLLAGFVEPGETLEAAVIREVREEASVECHSPRYVGSQPWPFPCSLMLGFTAQASSTAIAADQEEMSHVRWFTRAELSELIRDGKVTIPGEVSIAGQILNQWLAEV